MHDTAMMLGAKFFELYSKGDPGVLDVGSMDVNGTLRDVGPRTARWTGVDVCAGKGVDVVFDPEKKLPFGDDEFDLVVSSSCLEHDPMFWMTFAEMMRVLEPGGFCYLNVPSNGKYHAHPFDCWRFYPDSGLALAKWARFVGMKVDLVESFVANRRQFEWNDQVMIFAKGEWSHHGKFICEVVPCANVRKHPDVDALRSFVEPTEDQRIINRLRGMVRNAQ